MSTRSLLVWVALVAGVELALRGYLGGHPWTCHAGALLFALGLAGLAWPTRGRGAGLVAAAALALLAAADAAWAAWGRAEAAEARAASTHRPAGLARALAGLRCPPDVAILDVSAGEPRWRAELEGKPRLALVYAGGPIFDEVGEPALRRALGGPMPDRGSPGLAALERRWLRRDGEAHWRRLRDAEPPVDPARSPLAARYREALLAARRSGAEVRVLVAAPEAGEPAATPEARARWLASRRHVQLVRRVAGAYGLGVEELGSEEEALRERVASDSGCRERSPSVPDSASGRGSGRTA